MKKRILTAICLVGCGLLTTQAQELGYSIGGHIPSQAAILDVNATNKGVLIPRIALETTTFLQGGKNPEGVIVYNTGTITENTGLMAGFYYWSGSKWEQVVGNTLLSDQITNIDNKFTTEIKSITNIIGEPVEGEKTDISYLVSYNPETTVFTYLMPKEGGGYDKKEIDFKTATKEAETNTFIKELVDTDEESVSKGKVKGYLYFSENAITAWLKADSANTVDNIPEASGTQINVLGVVNNNFKEIFNNDTNTETINEIIKNAPDNVWVEVKEDGKTYLVYTDKNKETQIVPLDQNETQTSMFKHTVKVASTPGEGTSTETLEEATLEEGSIYYSYQGEHGKTFYINMTNDIVTSIQNNTTLKEEIFNTVNNYSSDGGNVYYGKIEGSTDDVLYIFDENKKPKQLDISKDIIKVLEETTNNVIVETILKQTEVKVLTDSAVKVNVSIDGFNVYKGKYTANVVEFDTGAGYNTEFNAGFAIANLDTLLGVQIIKDKQVVQNSVTAVSYDAGILNFKFGMGNLQSTLLKGDYQVIIDYVSTEKSETK